MRSLVTNSIFRSKIHFRKVKGMRTSFWSSKKMLLSIAFVVCFLLTTITQVYAGNIASYPAIQQEETNWCWAASSVSILKYLGTNESQCGFVMNAKPADVACYNVAEDITTVIQTFIWPYGKTVSGYTGSLSWANLKTEIDNSKPIYVSWKWESGGGHAVVVYGYSQSGTFVNYMDPWTGIKQAMNYDSFKGGTSYDRTWRWGAKGFSN
jgi:hypothetical protein